MIYFVRYLKTGNGWSGSDKNLQKPPRPFKPHKHIYVDIQNPGGIQGKVGDILSEMFAHLLSKIFIFCQTFNARNLNFRTFNGPKAAVINVRRRTSCCLKADNGLSLLPLGSCNQTHCKAVQKWYFRSLIYISCIMIPK